MVRLNFVVFILLVGGFSSPEIPNIKHLGSFFRLNNESYIDNYFSCTCGGPRVQWQINNNMVFLDAIDIGKARLCLDMKIQCIATLLTLTSSNQFYSILIVSTTSAMTNFSVNCTSDTRTSNTIYPAGNIENAMLNRPMDKILLQYLFQTDTVNNLTTYFYICGVNDILQAWRTTGVASGYFPADMIGDNRTKIVNNVAVEAAILIGYEPYEFVSILLVTEQSNVNVTCASSSLQSVLFFHDISAPIAPIESTTVNDKIETDSMTENMSTENMSTENMSTENMSTENMSTENMSVENMITSAIAYSISSLGITIIISVTMTFATLILLLVLILVITILYFIIKLYRVNPTNSGENATSASSANEQEGNQIQSIASQPLVDGKKGNQLQSQASATLESFVDANELNQLQSQASATLESFVDAKELNQLQSQASATLESFVDAKELNQLQSQASATLESFVDAKELNQLQSQASATLESFVDAKKGNQLQSQANTTLESLVDEKEGNQLQSQANTDSESSVDEEKDMAFTVNLMELIDNSFMEIKGKGTKIAIIGPAGQKSFPFKHKAFEDKIAKDDVQYFSEYTNIDLPDHITKCAGIVVGKPYTGFVIENDKSIRHHYHGGVAPEAKAKIYLIYHSLADFIDVLIKIEKEKFDVICILLVFDEIDEEDTAKEKLNELSDSTLIVACAANSRNGTKLKFPANLDSVISVGGVTEISENINDGATCASINCYSQVYAPACDDSNKLLEKATGTSKAASGIAGLVCLFIQCAYDGRYSSDADKQDVLWRIKKKENMIRILEKTKDCEGHIKPAVLLKEAFNAVDFKQWFDEIINS